MSKKKNNFNSLSDVFGFIFMLFFITTLFKVLYPNFQLSFLIVGLLGFLGLYVFIKEVFEK